LNRFIVQLELKQVAIQQLDYEDVWQVGTV
jgi:hypothetical protein